MVLNGNDPEVGPGELIRACQRGDNAAFATLFESHKDKVFSIALRYSGDHAAAMDIAQDTFLKLWSHIKDFRGESSFDGWLYRIVSNACMDYQRRRKRLTFVDGLLEMFRSPRETALQDLVREEIQQNVQQVVDKLPPEQRMAVILRYMEDLSYEEIADVMGCSRGTVASRLNRAHKTLERRLRHLRGREEGQGGGNE